MERRRFVILTLAGTAAISLPLSQCNTGSGYDRPDMLYSLIGRTKTLEIGKAYIRHVPSESNHHTLTALISAARNEPPASPGSIRIQNEFRNGKVVVINGWILSVTEARLSALYYLNSLR